MRKLTFLFALLCASVMAFADWTGQVTGSATNVWLDGINTADTRTTVNYTVNYEVGYSGGTLTVTIGFTDDNFGKTVGLVPQMFVNNGYKGNFSGSVWSSNDYSVGDELDMYIYFAYNGGANGSSHFNYTVAEGGGGGGGAFDPSTIDWSSIDFISGSSQFKIYFTDANRPANYTTINVQTAPWADNNTGIYVTFPDGVSACSLIDRTGCWIEGAQVLMYLTAFVDEVTEVTITHASGTKTLYIYNASASSAEPTEIYDTNFALESLGASATSDNGGTANNAIDNDDGSSWESTHGVDAVKLTIDLGQKRIFNTVQIRWEGAYGKAFTIDVSNDGTDWTTVKSVDETLPGPFPYEQTLEFAKTTAQYIRFNGIERGLPYGYNMFSFRVLLPGVSVLTSITLTSPATIAQISGAGVALTAQPKDQNGQNMEAEVSWEITPAAAGHMSGNTYIPDQIGNASIRAYNGDVYSTAVSIIGVPSANLALSTNITTDNKIIAQSEFSPSGTDAFYAVDGNIGSVWQGSPTAGNVGDSRVYDSWFVVDLGAFYNIDLVALHFEGACSELYHIDFSANNSDWNLGYNLVGAEGINARNDYWTELDNNIKVRYVRFWSTKAATGWGMKLFEFEVYGTEWTSSDDEKPVMESASLVSSTSNSAVIAVSATDNDEVARFHVVDATNGIDANFTPSAGNITITGLTHATDYNFTITAKDASNNESESSIVVAVSTPFDGSINLALNQPCEGGYYDNNPAESDDKANDGLENTQWVTYGAHAAELDWWIVDLGKIYNLTNITALWANDAYATNYILQARVNAPTTADKANDAAWVTLATVSGVTAGEEKSTNVSGVGRYVRFRATANVGGFFRLREFRVFGSGVVPNDTEKPVMSSASLVSNTDAQAVIAVSATDNVGIASYHVVDAGNNIDATFAPEAGQITVTGLTGGTAYTFVIKAVDLFGNESDNSKSVAVTTTAHYTEPQAACAAPTWDAAWVKAMYSPTYTADCVIDAWGSGTTATDDTYGKKCVVGSGYFGMVNFELNCLLMEKVHFDIWVADDMTIRFVPIWGGDEQGITKNLSGQSWNSIDIDLTDYTNITNWGNITQFKLDQMPSNFNLWIANAYFYRTSAIVDSEAPTNASASLAATGFYSVKITASAEDNSGAVNFSIKNDDTEVATGAAATGVATTITVSGLTPGTAYNFNVIALDEAGNEASPIAVAATTKAVPASAPAPVTSGKNIVPVYSDVLTGALTGIRSGDWGETTAYEWLQITSSDQVFYVQNFNYAGWHSWGANIDATDMMFLHVDFYSTGMTQVSVTPISPGREGVANVALTPNAWTSADVPLSTFAANNIDWSDIFQFKFMSPVGGNELMIDNVYFWQPVANTTPDVAGQANTGGWATFSCAEKVAVPTGMTAYKAVYQKEGNDETLVLTALTDGIIPAGAGVILQGAAGEAYAFSVTDATPTTDLSDNMLVGCPVRTDITSVLATNDVFCLRYSEAYSMTGFFLYTGQYVPAGKAYLALPKQQQGAGAPERRLRFVISEEQTTTAIVGAEAENAKITKFVENGQLFIRRGDTVYTIQGTRVK